MVILWIDQETIIAAALDQISAHNVVRAAEEGVGDPEADARPSGVTDDVVGDQVVVALLDADAVAASGDVVSGDDVSDARAKGDADAVLNHSVAPDLIALAAFQDEGLAPVTRHQVRLDQVAVRVDRVDGVTGVVSERVAHDPDVPCAVQGQPEPKQAADRAVRGAVSDQASGGLEELDADVRAPRDGDAEQATVP